MKRKYNKIIVIHPGTQYAYRLCNALKEIKSIDRVLLLTWFVLSSKDFLARFKIFKKRVKIIDDPVKVINFPFFEVFLFITIKFYKSFKRNNNNPYYFWQSIFGYFLLPFIYTNRKSSIIVVFETCGWPITKYAKKWNIPVVMDFASISHESAEMLGIQESSYGIKIKTLERQNIDYGLNCSNFASETYENKTSAKKHFVAWLGTDFNAENTSYVKIDNQEQLNICCLANTEYRKGLDILLDAFNKIEIPQKRLYLIGRLDPTWVSEYCKKNNYSQKDIILTGPKAQQDLKPFLILYNINLHILPSRFDSFGMVVPETMALGIPNIVSPFVGAGEMLEHTLDGFIMEKLTVKDLVLYINEYAAMTKEDKDNLSKMAIKKSTTMTWNNYNERVRVAFESMLSDI